MVFYRLIYILFPHHFWIWRFTESPTWITLTSVCHQQSFNDLKDYSMLKASLTMPWIWGNWSRLNNMSTFHYPHFLPNLEPNHLKTIISLVGKKMTPLKENVFYQKLSPSNAQFLNRSFSIDTKTILVNGAVVLTYHITGKNVTHLQVVSVCIVFNRMNSPSIHLLGQKWKVPLNRAHKSYFYRSPWGQRTFLFIVHAISTTAPVSKNIEGALQTECTVVRRGSPLWNMVHRRCSCMQATNYFSPVLWRLEYKEVCITLGPDLSF